MKNKNTENWLKEYQDFLNFDESTIPVQTNTVVIKKINTLLNPSSLVVFFKILGIHLSVGFLSLSICHQFGINPFNTEKSLSDWMMNVAGHQACMIGCGVLFVGLSLLAAGYFLTIEEVNALKRTRSLQTLVLGLISLGLFVVFGAELVASIAGLWLLGGFIGGFAATETVWRLKRV